MSLDNIDKTRASRTEVELRAWVEAIYTSPAGGDPGDQLA
jgi:hypothetical protein